MDNSKNNFDPDLSNPVGVTHIATSVIMIIKLTDTVYFTDPITVPNNSYKTYAVL